MSVFRASEGEGIKAKILHIWILSFEYSISATPDSSDWLPHCPDLHSIHRVCGKFDHTLDFEAIICLFHRNKKKRKLLFVVESSINSAIFQILGWMSLFIPAESVPGRVGMGMTTLLTLTAMFSAVIIGPWKMFI